MAGTGGEEDVVLLAIVEAVVDDGVRNFRTIGDDADNIIAVLHAPTPKTASQIAFEDGDIPVLALIREFPVVAEPADDGGVLFQEDAEVIGVTADGGPLIGMTTLAGG